MSRYKEKEMKGIFIAGRISTDTKDGGLKREEMCFDDYDNDRKL